MRQKVLIVDDEPDLRKLIGKNLEHAGFEVVDASGGHKALELFAEFLPDVVVMDVMMPDLDGFATCAKLRELPGGGDVPVAFLTADGSPQKYERALASGVNAFLTKPIKRDELISRVTELAQWKVMADSLRQETAAVSAKVDLLQKIRDNLGTPVARILSESQTLLAATDDPTRKSAEHIRVQALMLQTLVDGLIEKTKKA